MPRRLLAVVAAAFALRLAVAAVAARTPLFPPFYFTDARLAEANAADMARAWRSGAQFSAGASPAQRFHAGLLAVLLLAFGPHPWLGQALNCALGALCAALMYAAAVHEFGPGPALASAAFVALWPSHAFNTSQNFKEAPVLFLAWSGLAAVVESQRRAARGERALPWLAAGTALMAACGFLRLYVCAAAAAAVAAGWLTAAVRKAPLKTCVLGLAAAAAALPLCRFSAGALLAGPLRENPAFSGEQPRPLELLPRAYDPRSGASIRPLSPEGIARARRLRQDNDQIGAAAAGRRVGSQLFYGQELRSWLDVALFLPKSAFYALFMPLPGLYPSEGKPGRLLAGAEDCVLLLLACCAAAELLRRRQSPATVTLLVFFGLMLLASAAFELDLGGAVRHRLAYFPALLPFAFSWLLSRGPRGRLTTILYHR